MNILMEKVSEWNLCVRKALQITDWCRLHLLPQLQHMTIAMINVKLVIKLKLV